MILTGLTPDQQLMLLKCTVSVATIAFGFIPWLLAKRYWVYAKITPLCPL